MISFTPSESRLILQGRKTLHCHPVGERRLVTRPGPRGLKRTGESAHHWQEPWRPRAAHVAIDGAHLTVADLYPLRDDSGEQVATVTAADVTMVRLGDIDPVTARKLGHADRFDRGKPTQRNVDLFRWAWLQRHDAAWLARQSTDEDTATIGATAVQGRWALRWADVDAWLVTLELAEDRPVYLANRDGLTQSPGQAINDPAAEVIDAATLQSFARRAHEDRLSSQAAARRRRAATRFEIARAQAEAAGLDTANAVRMVERAAQALERKTATTLTELGAAGLEGSVARAATA